MSYMREEERAALSAAVACRDGLRDFKPLGERLQAEIRRANDAELRRRAGHQQNTSTLPVVRMIDARHPGLRHAVTTVLRFLEEGDR